MARRKKDLSRGNLEQNLSEKFVWAIAYGSSIGWGAFILPGDWIGQAGPIGASIGIFLGALLMIVIAISYGALVEKFPVSGGAFAFGYLGFGKYVSFFSSWFLTFGYICIVALNASAFSLLFKFVMPGFLEQGKLYTIAGWDVYITEIILSSLILLIFAWISIKGSSFSGNLQYIFCVILAVVVVLLFAGSFFTQDFSFSNLQPAISEKEGWLGSILLILAVAPWAYVGFDNIPQTAEEFNFAPSKTFKLIVFSLLASAITYVMMILLTSWLFKDPSSIGGNLWVTGSVVKEGFSFVGLAVLIVSIMMGIFTGLNGFFMSSSRLLFSMGRAAVMPSVFKKLHPKYNTPYISIIFILVLALVAPWLGRTALTWIVDMSSTGVSIAYFITCLSAFKLFSYDKRSMMYHPKYKTFALIGAIIALIFLGLLLIPGSPASLSLPSYIALFVWLILGLVFFMVRYPSLKKMTNDELNYLVLDKSKEEMIELEAKTEVKN
ncbi:amino acid permease [Mammaliicoccus lentus]|uniref:APC family permease n=1 Tax=Mammaliicoccus TaxID=2803850 RepID=UPI0007D8F303|nr:MULTISPECIES: APC family permease [Mammaliicoccus]MBW0770116.1 APC family permease [Mammaliicoccus lentus]OAO32859.1 amino acid permease [Mammaliicoccus lentus]QMU09994.1 APC family permease [Mammaliicoccus lentus]SCU19855.1 putative amino acid permease [Mammaliicoccus lentus]HJF22543.1 APC family permease [Mammaliicoccus lentus]